MSCPPRGMFHMGVNTFFVHLRRDKKWTKILYVQSPLVATAKIRNRNVGKASYFVRRKRHTFAVLLVVGVIQRRFTFFHSRVTYVILRLLPTATVRRTKNIERIDGVCASCTRRFRSWRELKSVIRREIRRWVALDKHLALRDTYAQTSKVS